MSQTPKARGARARRGAASVVPLTGTAEAVGGAAGARPVAVAPGLPDAGATEQSASTPVRVRALIPSLSPAEQRVAQVILDEAATAAGLTITELAERADTSETTVIRFCRALGFSGYPELRLTLATEAGRAGSDAGSRRIVGSDIGPNDTLSEIVEKVCVSDVLAVEDTATQLDIATLGEVVEALVGASRVDIYGVGASAFVALDFQQKLHRIGRVAFAWSDVHIALTSAALLRPGDVAIGISHTGSTRDTVEALAEARRHGATTVAVTNFPKSPIAGTADLVLTTAARETTFRSGAMASRIAQLSVVDCVFVGVAQRTYTATRSALEATYEAVAGRRLPSERGRR